MCPRFAYGETIGSPTHIPRGVYHLDLAVLVLFCNLIELPFFFFPSHTRDWVVQLAARCNHFSPVVTNGQVWINNLKITPRKRAGENLNQQLSEHKHKDCYLPSTAAPKDKTHEEKAQTVTGMWSKIKKRCKNIQNTNMQKNSKRKHAGRGSDGPSLTRSRKKVFLLKLIGRR